MDSLLFAVLQSLWRGHVGVQLDLVDGWDNLAGRVVEQLLQIGHDKIGYTDVSDLAGTNELLHLAPGAVSTCTVSGNERGCCLPSINKVPVVVMLLQILWHRRTGPMHQV